MKNTIISHLYTGNSLTVVFTGPNGFTTKIVESSHVNWPAILKAYKARDFQSVISLSDVRSAIVSKFNGAFQISGDAITYNGQPIAGYLFDRIIYFLKEGLPYEHLVRFAQNLYENPSNKSREELYNFLVHKNMPITQDGCVLGYKAIRADFYSKTGGTIKVLKGTVDASGHILNQVGEEIIVDRGEVDDRTENHCSRGLHIGSKSYSASFGSGSDLTVIVKFNPRDAVSVPNDHNGEKLRVCRYEIVGVETRTLSDKRDIYYDKNPQDPTPYSEEDLDEAFEEGWDSAWDSAWDEAWNEGVSDRDNPVLNGTAETATGPNRNSLGQFVSSSESKRDSLGRFCS